MFGDLQRFGDVIKGGYLHEAHPPHSSVIGVRGRGEGGVYATSNARERGRGEGAKGRGRVRGIVQKGVVQREGLISFNEHLPLVGLVGREQPRASVLGRGTLAVSQAAVLASPYRGGRLGGRI